MYKQPRSVQVVIFADDSGSRRYLLLHRIESHGGFWQSVTGSLEPGETAIQAALRETKEETGISALVARLIDLRITNVFKIAPQWLPRFPPGTVYNEEVCFALAAPESEIVLDHREHDDYMWAGYNESMELVYWESTRRALAATNLLRDVIR
ncbi:MAG TPA: dihydroneopterin triphosphate diphosphatase [Blastocatellia bacterium]